MKKLKKPFSKKAKAVDPDDPLAGDLSKLMMGGVTWQAAEFELTRPKNKTVTLRMSEELLDEVKEQARKVGVDYQRFIRLTLENSVRRKD